MALPVESLALTCFLPEYRPHVAPLAPTDIAVIIHVRPGQSGLLIEQIQHYRSMGASTIFLLDGAQIDAGHELHKLADVHVFRPLPGVSEAVATATLARMHLQEDAWYLVTYAEEFIMAARGVFQPRGSDRAF